MRIYWNWRHWVLGISFAWFVWEFDYEVDVFIGPLQIIIPTHEGVDPNART